MHPWLLLLKQSILQIFYPWIAQNRTTENGRLVVLPVTDTGKINLEEANKVLEKYLCSLHPHLSNVTGIDSGYKRLCKMAHDQGIKVVIDACQTIGTHEFDSYTYDYAVFSGHKMYGPTGVGVLYSRLPFEQHRAVRLGGGSVVHYDLKGNIEFYDGPTKHEVGTPNIAGVLGLGRAPQSG